MKTPDKSLVCLVGPTAIGKTALSQDIAVSIDAEIISCDSMQIYRGMDIGTGKITPDEQRVTHYGIDIVDPGEEYSAALFQTYARDCIGQIQSRGKRVVLCGGTGFYLRSVIDDYDFPQGSVSDNPVRERYNAYLSQHGEDAIWHLLESRDPKSARLIHPHNTRRVIRALELLEEGKTYAQQKENLASIPQAYDACIIGLTTDRAEIYDRINRRVDGMIAAGLVDEVQRLLDRGFQTALTAPQAIGYKEIVAHLQGECTLQESVEAIKQASRRYAKRQLSWFNRDRRVHWIDAQLPYKTLIDQALAIIQEHR